MSCRAHGRCHFCSRRHTLQVFGSKESEHDVMQKTNVNLIVLNTVCSSCINMLDGFIKTKTKSLAEFIKEKNMTKHIFQSDIYSQDVQASKYPKYNSSTTNKECQTKDILYKTEYVTSECMNTSKTNSIEKKTSVRLYCNFCYKEFNHTGDLNKHKRKHTKEKPILCNFCQQKFSHASNLARHQRLHSGERPFLCEKCQCSFSRKDKLSQHISSKHCTLLSSSINMQ